MMTQPIFDMHAVAARHEFDASPGVVDVLIDGLLSLPESSPSEVREDLQDLADRYDESQPSFAADLRAALNESDA